MTLHEEMQNKDMRRAVNLFGMQAHLAMKMNENPLLDCDPCRRAFDVLNAIAREMPDVVLKYAIEKCDHDMYTYFFNSAGERHNYTWS